MRYLADDGEIFEAEQDCREHEQTMEAMAHVAEQVDEYLKASEDTTDRAKTMRRGIIMDWERWKVGQPQKVVVAISRPAP